MTGAGESLSGEYRIFNVEGWVCWFGDEGVGGV